MQTTYYSTPKAENLPAEPQLLPKAPPSDEAMKEHFRQILTAGRDQESVKALLEQGQTSLSKKRDDPEEERIRLAVAELLTVKVAGEGESGLLAFGFW